MKHLRNAVCAESESELLWSTDVGAPIFAPLSSLQPALAALSGAAHSAAGSDGSSSCRSNATSEAPGSSGGRGGSGAAGGGSTVVLVPDQSGCVSGLCLHCGHVMWQIELCGSGSGSGSCGDVAVRASVMVTPPLPPLTAAAPVAASQRIAWTAGPGAAGVAEVPSGGFDCSNCGAGAAGCSAVSTAGTHAAAGLAAAPAPGLAAHAQPTGRRRSSAGAASAMPAEAFSMPVGFGGRLVFGCRDDHLYCVSCDADLNSY